MWSPLAKLWIGSLDEFDGDLGGTGDRIVLKWSGYVVRLEERRWSAAILLSEFDEVRVRDEIDSTDNEFCNVAWLFNSVRFRESCRVTR